MLYALFQYGHGLLKGKLTIRPDSHGRVPASLERYRRDRRADAGNAGAVGNRITVIRILFGNMRLKKEYDLDVPIIPVGIKYHDRSVTLTCGDPVYQDDYIKTLNHLETKKHIKKEVVRIFEIIKGLS